MRPTCTTGTTTATNGVRTPQRCTPFPADELAGLVTCTSPPVCRQQSGALRTSPQCESWPRLRGPPPRRWGFSLPRSRLAKKSAPTRQEICAESPESRRSAGLLEERRGYWEPELHRLLARLVVVVLADVVEDQVTDHVAVSDVALAVEEPRIGVSRNRAERDQPAVGVVDVGRLGPVIADLDSLHARLVAQIGPARRQPFGEYRLRERRGVFVREHRRGEHRRVVGRSLRRVGRREFLDP